MAWEKGTANADCDVCGETLKLSDLRKEWNGLMACDGCWEPRHPNDKGPIGVGREKQISQNLRPRPDLDFLSPGDVKESDL
jgi:hypothetical protein